MDVNCVGVLRAVQMTMIALAAFIVETGDPPAIAPVEQAVLVEMHASRNGFGSPPKHDLDDPAIRQDRLRPLEKHDIHVGIYAIILPICRPNKNPGRFRPGSRKLEKAEAYFVAAS